MNSEPWPATTIGHVVKVRRGASPRPIQDPRWFAPTGPGWIRIADVSRSSRILRSTEQYLSSEGVSKSVRLGPGDLVLSIAGTIGKPIILGIDACIHDGFVYFPELHRSSLLAEFLYYFFQYKQAELAGQGQPGTQKNVNTSIIESMALGLPPPGEQRKIAAILSSVDDAIEATQAVIDQLQVVKKAMMAELLTRGLPGRHTRFTPTEIGEVPEGWTVCRIQDVGAVDAGKARDPDARGTPRPYLRVANVFDGRIRTNDVNEMPFTDREFERFALSSGDVLLNEGQSLDLVGRCSIYRGELGRPVAFQNALLRFRSTGPVLADFAEQYFRWCQGSGRFAEIATQTTSIAHLGLRRFAEMTMHVPPVTEQQEIADVLSAIDARSDAERSVANQLLRTKSALMAVLLTGEVRVTAEKVAA